MLRHSFYAAFTSVVLVVSSFAASASDLASPTGDVILTVSGDISVTNHDDLAVFDLAMLQAMDPEQISTTTIWTDGTQSFTGVSLVGLMDTLQVSDGILKATAINDYSVEMPLSDAAVKNAIVAYLNNGAPMSVRDKGPLWIIFPFDSAASFQTELVYSRSIWQLDRLHVLR